MKFQTIFNSYKNIDLIYTVNMWYFKMLVVDFNFVQLWPNMDNDDQQWSAMIYYDYLWSTMINYYSQKSLHLRGGTLSTIEIRAN